MKRYVNAMLIYEVKATSVRSDGHSSITVSTRHVGVINLTPTRNVLFLTRATSCAAFLALILGKAENRA